MKRSVAALLAALLLAIAGRIPVAAEANASATARWEAEPGAPDPSLVLRFPAPPLRVETTVAAWGLEIVLDVPVAEPLPEGVRQVREGGVTRLRVERAGAALRGVRHDGVTVTIAVTPAPAVAGDGSDYRIGIGDVVSVAVYKNPDLSGEFPVTPDGKITMPLIGAVPAAGRTERVFSEELTGVLAKDFLVDPQVSVSVKSYQSQFVYVTGAVPRSSRVAIRPGVTLRGVLAEAGVALSQGMTVELRRASGEASTMDSAGLDEFAPRHGDVLTVQEPRYVSLYGEVRRPNRVVLTPGLTLLQAITLVEGLTEWASKKEIRILRKGPNGPEEVTVNLNKVEERETPDPVLQADDVVIVKRRFL